MYNPFTQTHTVRIKHQNLLLLAFQPGLAIYRNKSYSPYYINNRTSGKDKIRVSSQQGYSSCIIHGTQEYIHYQTILWTRKLPHKKGKKIVLFSP